MTKHQDMTPDQMNIQIDIAVEVHLVINIKEKSIPIIDKDLHLELVTILIEIQLLHITPVHVMIIIKETLHHIVHHTGLHTDPHTHVIHALDTNLDLIPEIITLSYKNNFIITLYYRRRFTYWIMRCPFLIKGTKPNESHIFNSRILNPQEQKLVTLERELLGIVHALQIYEFINI